MRVHEVEYAGFQYLIEETAEGKFCVLVLRGQHPAANKEKHRRAALEIFMERFIGRKSHDQ